MKKLLLTLFAILTISVIAIIGAMTTSAATEGIYTYTITDRTATITSVDTSASGDIIIPSTLGEYSVTSIGPYAFYGCSSLTSITIPNTLTLIDIYAFYKCTSLTSVYIKSPIVAQYSHRHNSGLYSYARAIYIDEKITEISESVLEAFPCKLSGVEYEGTTYNQYFLHSFDNVCDTDCDCGFTREITHSFKTTWDKDDTHHWHACSVCGAPEEKIAHQYGNVMDENCDVCGYTRNTTIVIIIVIGTAVVGVGGSIFIGKFKKK